MNRNGCRLGEREAGRGITSMASVSKPTRLKSSINEQMAMFKAVNRGEVVESAFSRYDKSCTSV